MRDYCCEQEEKELDFIQYLIRKNWSDLKLGVITKNQHEAITKQLAKMINDTEAKFNKQYEEEQ